MKTYFFTLTPVVPHDRRFFSFRLTKPPAGTRVRMDHPLTVTQNETAYEYFFEEHLPYQPLKNTNVEKFYTFGSLNLKIKTK